MRLIIGRLYRRFKRIYNNKIYQRDFIEFFTTGFSEEDLNEIHRLLNHKKKEEFHLIEFRGKKIDNTKRDDSLSDLIKPFDQYEMVVSKLALKYMPTEYIEYFDEHQEWCQKNERIVNTEIGVFRSPMESHPALRYTMANIARKKKYLISMQHGGGYGVKEFPTMEQLEIKLCDTYLSWGWKNENNNVSPFCVTKGHWLKKFNYLKKGHILIIGEGLRRYFHNLFNTTPDFNKVHLEYNIKFLKGIKSEHFSKVIYRCHFNYGVDEKDYLNSIFKNLNISTRDETSHFYDLLYKTKLVIITGNLTSLIQAFMLNLPTLILWPAGFNQIREKNKIFYSNLNNAGILYYSPDQCAKKVNKIGDNPLEWWESSRVQLAKETFLNGMARSSQNLPKEFCKLVNNIKSQEIGRTT